MQKAYTEADLIALINQYKSRKSYALHCASDPAYVQSSLDDIDRQISALQKRRDQIVSAVDNTKEVVELCDRKMASYRKKLEFVRKHGSVSKLLALKAKAESLQREIDRKS